MTTPAPIEIFRAPIAPMAPSLRRDAPPADATRRSDVGPLMQLDGADNVAVARKAVLAGARIGELTAREAVAAGHKIALRALSAGERVVLDGQAVGTARTAIAAGGRIDAAMVAPLAEAPAASAGTAEAAAPGLQAASATASSVSALLPAAQRAQFQGYVRQDGRVGTRNYIVVVCTVNCAATTVRRVADHFNAKRLAAFPNVDGVIPLVHELGCGMEMSGEPMQLLRRTIAGQIRNANVAAALVVSLGCERNHIPGLLQQEKLEVGPRLHTLVMQETGGTRKTIDAGIAAVEAMLPIANQTRREPVTAEHLIVGLQSAGVQGFSALSANRALGAAADLLVANGATVVLSRTSEIASSLSALTARAASPEVAQQLHDRVDWWRSYSSGRDTPISGHQPEADRASGILNATEAANGYLRIAGSSALNQVVNYAFPVTSRGLVFMDTPSDDAISVSGQSAGGATLVCLTTGLGSTFGSLPAPTLKLASNTPVYESMEDDLDVNCGSIIDGTATVDEVARQIFEQILRHASGEQTKSEELGAGENEFAPWPIGVTS